MAGKINGLAPRDFRIVRNGFQNQRDVGDAPAAAGQADTLARSDPSFQDKFLQFCLDRTGNIGDDCPVKGLTQTNHAGKIHCINLLRLMKFSIDTNNEHPTSTRENASVHS